MQSVARLLPRVYRKLARAAADEQALLVSLWPVVVGEKVAAHTRAVRLFGATLIVDTDSQIWRKQLASLTERLVPLLNAAADKDLVKDLQFRVIVPQTPLPPRRASSASGFEPDEAAAIADPHLRRLYRLSRRQVRAK